MTKEKLKVGITGGIGSGKTTVCRIFAVLGIPVYYADERAKMLMIEDKKIRAELTKIFGKKTYLPDGNLNRKHLASVVFEDKEKLRALESVVHPAVHRDGKSWHDAQQNVPYTLREAALLVENGSYKKLDKLIMVFAPEETRIQRVMQRDGADRAAVEARIKAQLSDAEKLKVSDFVIYNDGEKSLIRQVLKIHRTLRYDS